MQIYNVFIRYATKFYIIFIKAEKKE